MHPLAIRTLYVTLIATWFTQSAGIAQEGVASSAVEPPWLAHRQQAQLEEAQAYEDYIRSLEMIKVSAGTELDQAIETIPVETGVPITPEQEADLRDWLYDFLVAFSASGSDSLAAAFYLREGTNNPEAIQQIKKQFESAGSVPVKLMSMLGMKIPKPPANVGDTPFEIFKAGHRFFLDMRGRDYFFGKAFFADSAYRVFEMQGTYESYMDYAKIHGLLPMGGSTWWSPKLNSEIKERLQAGEQWVLADVMFSAEEPEEFADFEGPVRYILFVRLGWSPERGMWRLVEMFVPNDAPVMFLFGAT